MDNIALGKLTPDTQASGSVVASIMGLNKYQTPNDTLLKAFAAVDREGNGTARVQDYIEAAEWGNKSENLILSEMAKRLECKIQLEVTEAVQHSSLPLACSLDGILTGNGNIVTTDPGCGIYVIGAPQISLKGNGIAEAKLTSVAPASTPEPYRGPIQVQAGMMCTDYTWAAIGTLFRGTELRIFLMPADPVVMAKIEGDVLDFQARIDHYKKTGEKNWYPALTPNDASQIFGFITKREAPIELPKDLSELAIEYADAVKAEKAIKNLKSEITTQLMEFMGDSEFATILEDGDRVGEVRWRMNAARKAYSVEARAAKRGSSVSIKIFGDEQ